MYNLDIVVSLKKEVIQGYVCILSSIIYTDFLISSGFSCICFFIGYICDCSKEQILWNDLK